MSGDGGTHNEWIEDLIIGRLLNPKVAAELTAPELEVLAAHIRSEILFSPEIHEMLGGKAKDVLRELRT
ncbi:hypothetical protein ACIBQX_38735 [Nonomuraea sp. NPDC049714]|uniref:hypothetical protein n=1 Tax=Nonomuraea sp. NPDC049714 TaxID=3364357 RepID=UPI0037A9C153